MMRRRAAQANISVFIPLLFYRMIYVQKLAINRTVPGEKENKELMAI